MGGSDEEKKILHSCVEKEERVAIVVVVVDAGMGVHGVDDGAVDVQYHKKKKEGEGSMT